MLLRVYNKCLGHQGKLEGHQGKHFFQSRGTKTIDGFATEGLLTIKIKTHPTHPQNRPIVSIYDNFAVTRAMRDPFSIALVTQ